MKIHDYPELQPLTNELLQPNAADEKIKRTGILSQDVLQRQNDAYANSGGISNGNRQDGFIPGFLNQANGEIIHSRFADGSPAPIHMLDGLPAHWVQKRDHQNHVLETHPGIIAGFIRNGHFYHREEVAQLATH